MDVANNPILLLRLEGPLQSWGERARWNQRDTAFFPTKSAVVGIIACAMGLARGDKQIIELCSAINIAFRADRPGALMTDYHTVTGIIGTAEGKQRGNKGEESTILSFRQYLQDAYFLVAITADEQIVEKCRAALLNPVWPVYLGRKSCVPTAPVLIKVTYDFESLDDVMQHYPFAEPRAAYESEPSRLYEVDDAENGYLRNDIVSDAPGRIYGRRRVTLKSASGG
jgi:CRISPR system Cascade subunit CasD